MSVKIEQPYPVFRDKIGFPLDGGLIYIGVAGLNPETNPVQCYFDEDFTLLAPQPLRTINGYISRNGSPSNIFLKVAECSITIKDRFRITQYTDLNFQLSNFGQLLASQIIDESGISLQDFNNGLDSVADMLSIASPKDGYKVTTNSYYSGLNKGGCDYYYDSSKIAINNGGSIIDGWVALGITSNVEQWGAKLDGTTNDTQYVKNCLEVLGIATINGNIKLDRIAFNEGWRIEGKSTINYTHRPEIPCILDSLISVNHDKMKSVYVFGIFDICEMLQIKTAGYNTIIHYGYTFTDGGDMTKAINAAEAIGINVIINSPNNVPPTTDVNLGKRNSVIGFYIFDEPQFNGISVSDQNARISAWRAVTSKKLFIADHGIYGFNSGTISDGFDVVFADIYNITASTDAENKLSGVMGYSELLYKCPKSQIIPCVGLFLGDGSNNITKNINFANDLYKCGDGDYCSFAWDAKSSDPSLDDITSNQTLYEACKIFNTLPPHRKYEFDINVFGQSSGLNSLMTIYNPTYSSSNTKPFAVLNVGSATDDRHQNFENRGIGIANAGGNIALNIRSKGYIGMTMFFFNYVDSGTLTLKPFQTPDDFYTVNDLDTKVLSHTNGFTSGYSISRDRSIGFSLVPSTTLQYYFKFVSGSIVNSNWTNSAF